jgi:hypothetical protein
METASGSVLSQGFYLVIHKRGARKPLPAPARTHTTSSLLHRVASAQTVRADRGFSSMTTPWSWAQLQRQRAGCPRTASAPQAGRPCRPLARPRPPQSIPCCGITLLGQTASSATLLPSRWALALSGRKSALTGADAESRCHRGTVHGRRGHDVFRWAARRRSCGHSRVLFWLHGAGGARATKKGGRSCAPQSNDVTLFSEEMGVSSSDNFAFERYARG